MSNPFEILEQNALNLRLVPISFREILYIDFVPCHIYAPVDGLFRIVLLKDSPISNHVLKDMISKKMLRLYVMDEDRDLLRKSQQENLINVTRSLSIGDKFEKAKTQINLLTLNMGYLYENPTDDQILQLQYQSAKNLATFLYANPQFHEQLYTEYLKQGHHFILAQPFISTLFLLGVLKSSRLYTDRDIELLFITSYLKDIGMSVIPTEKYDQESLSDDEKKLLSSHSTLSVNILKSRVQLSPSHLKIIENHHIFSRLNNQINFAKDDENFSFGFETMMVSLMDIVGAMTTERPYRKAQTLYNTLDFTRILIAEQYPQEFKLMVTYFKNFFKNSSQL